MRKIATLLLASAVCLGSAAAFAADGMIQLQSPYTVEQTVERFVDTAESKGLTIFAQVDHAAGAAKTGLDLRPTTVVIFGNPKAGTPFMQCAQTVGIDLPMKMLIWKDANGQVWLGYNDPSYIATRHDVEDCPAVEPIDKALASVAETTVKMDEEKSR